MAQTRAQRRSRDNGAAARPGRALWRRPVVLFVAAGAVTVVVLFVVLTWFSQQAATDEAVAEARSVTNVLARSVAEPAIPDVASADSASALGFSSIWRIFDRPTCSLTVAERTISYS